MVSRYIPFLLLCCAAIAQTFPFPGPAVVIPSGSSYTGPGDIQSGAKAWWGLRAYSAAKRGTKAVNVCDAADAHCVDALTSATTGNLVIPSSNPDCTGGACTIKIWYDQSGGTNCGSAACDVTQATIGNRATLAINCIGSLTCAQGIITNGEYDSTAPITSLTQPYTLSVVSARTGSFTSEQTVLYLRDGGGLVGFSSTTGQAEMFAGSFVQATAANTTTHAFQAMFNGASSNFYIDGSANTLDAGTNSAGGTSNVVLIGYAGIGYFAGNFFEAGAWAGDKSTNNSSMNSNQHTYWGF